MAPSKGALATTATKITTRIKYNDKDVNKKQNKKIPNKKIPLFLLITNSFRGPFKTKTKENLLPLWVFSQTSSQPSPPR